MIKVGIYGYGNLGRGVENAIADNEDMELAAVFTRRDPSTVKVHGNAPVVNVSEMEAWADKIDVLVLCGGSATDLPEQTPACAKLFNVVDSFDNHAHIPEHYANVDAAAKESGKLALISAGWDPGMFSITRAYSEAVLPAGKTYTFWGKGVSQGHSDAIRRIKGVKDARQYTVPVEATLEEVKNGTQKDYTAREMHERVCYVVLNEDGDPAYVEEQIKTMPNYFEPYNTTVYFVDEETLKRDHAGLPHGGFVIRSGATGWNQENKEIIEYHLTLDSNPEFTAHVLAVYARAVVKMNAMGTKGCITVLDVPPVYLSAKSREEQIAHLI